MLGPTEIIAGSSGAFCVVRVMEDAGATNPGDPKTGLVASTIDISYWRQGAAAVTELTEADATALDDAHDPSDVEEIGLGYYLVHLPDAAVAVGADFVHVMATATDCIGYGPTITLTDPVGSLFKSYVIDSEPSTSVARVSEFTGYANDELNGELVWAFDSSADEWHPCWVTDFVTTNGDFTLVSARDGGNIPFTVEAGVDRLWRGGLNKAQMTLPWNANWDAEVQSEAQDALTATFGAQTTGDLAALITTVDTVVDNIDDGVIRGTAQTGTLSVTQASTDLTGYVDSELVGRTITFTGGTADGQQSVINAYASASGLITFATITTAPANNDTFRID